jgi:large subunit ribosomal protein L15
MKLHDLRPADGAHTARTRVGRGIAAGKGKTAGRGTKGQKARAGGSIPPWFEGGQTPLHMRIPKLRGFKNRLKVDYEIVNVGDIAARLEAGAFAAAGSAPKKGEQMTINADILRAVGLVRDVRKPLKVLGGGELSSALFVVADAFTKSATEKIQAAGGAVNVLEVPTESKPALGVGEAATAAASSAPTSTAEASAAADAPAATETAKAAKPAKPARKAKASATDAGDDAEEPAAAVGATSPAVEPDAVPDTAEEPADTASVTGDDSEPDAVVPGDDA